MQQLRPPEAIVDIARRLAGRGRQAWAVGGAVRDALLHRPGGDWDIATDAPPDEVRRIFRRTVPIGIEHGTVGVLARDGVLYEVTTFRRDVETFGRHAVVAFADTIDEDLARRDFTFNAIAWNPLTGELRDPFDGAADLERRVLRTVGAPEERFAEDYLRVLRALRFAGHLRLRIESETWAALQAAVPRLSILSAERIREELFKVLAKTRAASVTLRLYEESGALAALVPELAATVGLDIGRGAGRDAWSIALAAVDALPPSRPLLRLAALLHGTGYPGARSRGLRGEWRVMGHETFAARHAEAVLRRLKTSNADTDRISTLVARQSDLFPPDAPPAGIRRWLLHVTPELMYDLFRLRIALCRADDAGGGGRDLLERWHSAHRVLLQHPVLSIGDLAVDGRDLKALGLPPGPRFGEILRALLERVIDDPSLNERETLMRLVRELEPA
jgi:tRNA nucleotidyltransferase/poly(A) polymerase